MVSTNVYAKRGSVFLALIFFLNCDATMRRPAPHVVAVESVPHAPSSVTATEPIPQFAPETMTTRDPYEDAQLNEPVDSPDAGPPSPTVATVIHYAELRGRVETHTGKRLTIEPLVITTSTLPTSGYKADLWVEAMEEDGTSDWQRFAAVKIAATLEFGMPMAVDIVNDEKLGELDKPALPTLPPGSKVRIQWEW